MATHLSILAWRIPMDRAAWWAIVHSVTKSQTRSDLAPPKSSELIWLLSPSYLPQVTAVMTILPRSQELVLFS